MYVLESCEPKNVFKYFEEISRIPRGSGNEKGVSDYIYRFAKEKGFVAIQDEAYNLVIRKPASAGFENAPVVIIQGHLDMVCEKNGGTEHDFEKDPLDIYIDGDFVKARGTTLGSDNGIAVAMGMALLTDNSISHPALEIVLTTDEEVGMNGATFLPAEHLTGTRLINIDNEEEGVFLSSCAGGVRTTVRLPIEYAAPPAGFAAYRILVSGLKGGHSGMDINKERGNSNRIMGRMLRALNEMDVALACINGGSKDNAIPREAEAVVLVAKADAAELEKKAAEIDGIIKHELRTSDAGVCVSVQPYTGEVEEVFSAETGKKVAAALMLLPNGIQNMSAEFEGLVETSDNIGVVSTADGFVKFTCSVRSSVISRKYYIVDQIKTVADVIGAEVSEKGNYPSWEYNPESYLRKVFSDTYREMYGKEAKIDAIHAGVECGLFAEKVKGIDMIAFGPDMFDVHTPDERLSISSVGRSWEFLLQILAQLK